MMKKGSHVSCHKSLQIKWISNAAVIGVLEVPAVDEFDTIAVAVGQAKTSVALRNKLETE